VCSFTHFQYKKMNTLRINDVELACEESGMGEALIFVHGAVGDFRTWETQMASFSAYHQVVAYSRRWHYPNTIVADETSYTPDVHTADLLALMDAYGPVHLVGHSYGAAVCAGAALQRPDLVRSLVFAEPSLFSLLISSAQGQAVMAQAVADIPHVVPPLRQGQAELALQKYLNIILGPGGFERVPVPARDVMLDNMHTLEPMLNGMNAGTTFTLEHAAQITAPTLLLDGEQSPLLFRLVTDELARIMPGAERVTLPGVSHGLHLENSGIFNRAVLQFLARVQATQKRNETARLGRFQPA
jgi:pimeloyl-ACP methyl ester carboxylesterase